MNRSGTHLVLLTLLLSFSVTAEESPHMDKQIDQRSYRLGSVGAFSEMVEVGVKTLALSAAVLPAEMDDMESDIARITAEAGIKAYRESDLLVSDLFPANVAVGKDVMLLYKGTTLDDYLALKQHKAELVKSGMYKGKARKDIARQFGKLLSYPDASIEEKINR